MKSCDQRPDIAHLSEAEKDALLIAQWEEIQRLRARLKALEGQLKKDSRTSNKAPSSDGPTKPKRTRSRREASGRKPGGQPGHEYHGLAPVDKADHIERHEPSHCDTCQWDLSGQAGLDYESRQVFDLPVLRLEVTEHRSVCKGCPVCGDLSWGEYPPAVVNPVQYGERVQALSVYLSDYQLLPYARHREFFADVFNHPLSVGTLQNIRQRCAQRLKPIVAAIGQALIDSRVVHFDESGLRVAAHRRWLHVASTATLTYYRVHPKRGRQALDEIAILPQLQGTAIHDGYSSYFGYAQCDHGLCNAHHLRELIFMHEHYEQAWAEELIDCLLAIKQAVDQAKAGGKIKLSSKIRRAFAQRYERILDQALEQIPELPPAEKPSRGRKKQHPAKNLLDRLRTHQSAVLAFMYDFQVPFDNNQAERDIRMLKVQQKISGGFRTIAGAHRFSDIRSYISTARKQGLKVMDVLQQVFLGAPWKPPEALPG
jgi:transposase